MKLLSGRGLATFGLLFALASIGGSLDGREARRKVIRARIVSVGIEEPVVGTTGGGLCGRVLSTRTTTTNA